jgi:hypothetical protein
VSKPVGRRQKGFNPMSIFNWFTRSSTEAAPTATAGLSGARQTGRKFAGGDSQAPQGRKAERIERREALYAVVRESMTGAGLLSGSYKFKVLSLDSKGRQYLIMVDLAEQNLRNSQLLVGVEKHIGKIAKARHDLLVTAVYWRVNEHLSAKEVAQPVAQAHGGNKRRFEPLEVSEIEAFKRALATVPNPPPLSAPGEIIKSTKRNTAPVRFSEAELNERLFPLSATQYGELN